MNRYRTFALGFALIQFHFANSALSLSEIHLNESRSTVEFIAVGSPSEIQIRGRVKDDVSNPVTGKLIVTQNKLSGDARFPLTALTTGIGMRDEHMLNKYLEVSKFEVARFTLSSLLLPAAVEEPNLSATDLIFKGSLSLHGREKEIQGLASVKRSGKMLELVFNFAVPTQDFGIETPSFMGISITKEVRVAVNVEANVE